MAYGKCFHHAPHRGPHGTNVGAPLCALHRKIFAATWRASRCCGWWTSSVGTDRRDLLPKHCLWVTGTGSEGRICRIVRSPDQRCKLPSSCGPRRSRSENQYCCQGRRAHGRALLISAAPFIVVSIKHHIRERAQLIPQSGKLLLILMPVSTSCRTRPISCTLPSEMSSSRIRTWRCCAGARSSRRRRRAKDHSEVSTSTIMCASASVPPYSHSAGHTQSCQTAW